LFPHMVHNFSHMFLWAYKHASYHPLTWIDEGIALAMEKEIEPRSATNEGEEGTYRDRIPRPDWPAEVRKMIADGEHKKLAELVRFTQVGELGRDELYTCWSMARFLIDVYPAELARLLGGLKGQLDAQGYQDGSDLPGLQRKLLKEIFDWTFQSLDEKWVAWATAPPAPPGK
jgi:hypothetical protein